MHFLVFQHIACEHPAIFREFMRQDGITWDTVALDEGGVIPGLEGYDALLVMGGPMDVWQKEDNPWLVAELAAINEWVSLGKPYLGFCLGHQLLAEAMGGEVGPSKTPEIGILPVDLTPEGSTHWFFSGAHNTLNALQWHSAEVTKMPEGGMVLAQSNDCAVNAMAYGDHAVSVQFHVELMENTVREWGDIPEYANALNKALGDGAMPKLIESAQQKMPEFNSVSKVLYDNFIQHLASN
ncbi:MAG: type 1 glutamine amidotransferase [Gammaproteobacteria bacterium]|nr:type 1 glutamine amidotransferase [Gammaproteobacteria bacterium]